MGRAFKIKEKEEDMVSKEGSISIETIVIIILAVLVLVIVAAAFSGGMKQLWDKIIGISQTTSEVELSVAQAGCAQLCSPVKLPAYDTTSYFVKGVGAKSCSEISPCAT